MYFIPSKPVELKSLRTFTASVRYSSIFIKILASPFPKDNVSFGGSNALFGSAAASKP